jgi:hypothetical protein
MDRTPLPVFIGNPAALHSDHLPGSNRLFQSGMRPEHDSMLALKVGEAFGSIFERNP